MCDYGTAKCRRRKDNFTEVVFGYDEEQAVEEATVVWSADVRITLNVNLFPTNMYNVDPDRLAGDVNEVEFHDASFILRDPNKCILCGLCVRACDEVMGVGARPCETWI